MVQLSGNYNLKETGPIVLKMGNGPTRQKASLQLNGGGILKYSVDSQIHLPTVKVIF